MKQFRRGWTNSRNRWRVLWTSYCVCQNVLLLLREKGILPAGYVQVAEWKSGPGRLWRQRALASVQEGPQTYLPPQTYPKETVQEKEVIFCYYIQIEEDRRGQNRIMCWFERLVGLMFLVQ
ncbi:Hypothetical_protein [Hexamita inflata]|uniref:Hypothetical_protein n=1 Tax=Hexamita inflata TaxID=28002 RepID=A0ABP1HQ28_9EUKA